MVRRAAGLDHHDLRIERPNNFDLAIGPVGKLPFEKDRTSNSRHHSAGWLHSDLAKGACQRNGGIQEFAGWRFGPGIVPIILQMLEAEDFLNRGLPGPGLCRRLLITLRGNSVADAYFVVPVFLRYRII